MHTRSIIEKNDPTKRLMDNINIFSMNCRGLGDYTKRKDVLHYIRTRKYQIICLQDIHVDKNLSRLMLQEWGLEGIVAPHTTKSRGVAILLNNNFDYKITSSTIDPNGNYIALKLQIQSENITLPTSTAPTQILPTFTKKYSRL